MKAVNLIPGEQRASTKQVAAGATPSGGGGGFGAYAVLGILAFAVVALALYVLANNAIKDNKAQLAGVEQEAQIVERQAASLQAFADFKTLSETRVATVRGLAASRFAWQRALDDVSRALPSDVYLSSFDGSTASATGGGSSLRGTISAPSIELIGCTRDQASVARLMSSLRGVRGVTRVSLSKSEAQESAQEAGLASTPIQPGGATASTISEPCPKGSPPTFDVIVFFERSLVNANAVPNATSGPAGATTGPTGASGAVTGPTGASGATTPTSTTP